MYFNLNKKDYGVDKEDLKNLEKLFDFPFEVDFGKNDAMKTDIEEKDDSFEMNIELPDIKKEDVKISLNEGNLVVEAVKNEKIVDKEAKRNFLKKERYFGSYSRSYYLGENIKEEDISAKMENGLLTITVKKPLKEEDNSVKYINIQ